MSVKGFALSAFVSGFLLWTQCMVAQPQTEPNHKKDYSTPTKKLELREYPYFNDDLDFDMIDLALKRQIDRFKKKKLDGTLTLGGEAYSQTQALASLTEFRLLAQQTKSCLSTKDNNWKRQSCIDSLNSSIRSQFDVFAPDLGPNDPRYGEDKSTFFTGYYTPTLDGQKTWSPEYPWAVYKKPAPKSLVEKTRGEIDFDRALEGRGLELFYTKDLFEIYLLQVEGGGKVRFTDGSSDPYYLSYAGTNGKRWNFISKHMKKMGYINSGSIADQREFLKNYPEKQEEIYRTCPSYVYFKKTAHQPEGSDLVSLTNRRSIATDYRLYPFKGLLAYVETTRLSENESYPGERINFTRFFLDQDTGGAIKGKGRVDIYFGESEYAGRAASLQKSLGNLYFLMLKK